nr:ankyrin repeat and protein kinase domain-containing protein 1-like isoform X2 [Crassostrea gigas]
MPGRTVQLNEVMCITVSWKISLYDCVNVTELCPRNKAEWGRRSNVFNCSNSNSYMCLPNEQLTALVEFCYNGPQTPINSGECLVLDEKGIGLESYNCTNFINDPNCVSVGKGCFLADLSCRRDSSSPTYTSSVTSIFTISSEPTKGNDKNMNDTALIAVTLLCVLLMISLAVTIVLLCTKKSYYQFIFCNRPKAENEENGDEIECQEEVVSLMQDRYQENKLSNETGDRKKTKAQSDKLIVGPASTYPKGQDSITTDSGLSISSGFGPLHISCARGHKNTVKSLIQKGASINAWDKDGKTPLYRSCENGHVKIIQLLLNSGVDVNLCDKDGFSPLYAACQEGHHDIVNLLLDNKADPNMMPADDTIV